MRSLRTNDLWIPALLVFGFLGLWEWAAATGKISAFLYPRPSTILVSLIVVLQGTELVSNLLATLARLLIGFLLGGVPGLLMGLFMGWKPRLRRMLSPIISALHPVPKIALFPLLLLIFGIGELSMSVLIALAIFFPTLVNAMEGVRQINTVYFEVASNLRASRWVVLRRVVIPSSLPFMFAGAQIGLNIGLIVTISVEMLQGRSGLGRMMWMGWQLMRLEEVYGVIVVVAIIGIVINGSISWLMRNYAPWYDVRGQV